LFEKILNVDENLAKKNCRDILDFYGHVCEKGTASEQVCRWILGKV
jgi:CDP-glycerol glycerophosphotransferase